MTNLIKILFLGDIVGKPGRRIVAKYLSEIAEPSLGNCCLRNDWNSKEAAQPLQFCIANAENASHGFGLTERNYNELVGFGIDALTSGNHIWDKKDIFNYIDAADKLIRPINYPKGVPGVGSRIFKKDDVSIGVINVLGRIFMTPIDSPWEIVEEEIKRIQYETPIVIIDFHAEATAEKISFGYFADRLGVSAVIGTQYSCSDNG